MGLGLGFDRVRDFVTLCFLLVVPLVSRSLSRLHTLLGSCLFLGCALIGSSTL
jgi:hypothetical protein